MAWARSNWHADVLEWLWFLNAHPGVTYKNMYGDKDTFRLAFSLAGKASAFWQARTLSPALVLLHRVWGLKQRERFVDGPVLARDIHVWPSDMQF